MSKLIDRLNQVAEGTPQPLGFRTMPNEPAKPKLSIVASLTNFNADRLPDAIAGAGAVLFKLAPEAKTLKQISQSLSDLPWGLYLEDTGKKEINPLIEAGCDFVVFTPRACVSVIPKEESKIGKILQVASTLNESLLRTINELAIDAVLIADEPKGDPFLTWHSLMLLRRLANLLIKPLLLQLPSPVTDGELQILWETGVDGVVVEADVAQPSRLAQLRQRIDQLTFPLRKRRRASALLPYISEEISTTAETEEEETI